MCIYDIYGPCSFPHGTCYTLLAQCFALGSFVFSTLALTSCFYVSVRPIPVEGEIELPKEGFGWLTRQVKVAEPPSYGKQCAYYDPEEREAYFGGDAMWNSGYAMACISVTLGVITMCVLFTTCCIAYKMPTFDGLFWTCVICFIAQALTFLSWGSDLCQGETEIPMECTWSAGTGMNLTAAMMWVWAANMIKSFPEALPPRKRKQRSQEDENDDGYDDDDGDGDVYMPNRHNNYDEDDDYYDEYNQGGEYNQGDNDDDGYYDEDGNWIENQYNDAYSDNEYNEQPDGYDNYEGDYNDDTDNSNTNGGGGYSDYENEDSSQDWAEGGGGTTNDEKEDDLNYGSEDDYDDDDDDEESSHSQQQQQQQQQ